MVLRLYFRYRAQCSRSALLGCASIICLCCDVGASCLKATRFLLPASNNKQAASTWQIEAGLRTRLMDAGKSRDRTQSMRIPRQAEARTGKNLGSSTWYGPMPYKEPQEPVTIRRQHRQEVRFGQVPVDAGGSAVLRTQPGRFFLWIRKFNPTCDQRFERHRAGVATGWSKKLA